MTLRAITLNGFGWLASAIVVVAFGPACQMSSSSTTTHKAMASINTADHQATVTCPDDTASVRAAAIVKAQLEADKSGPPRPTERGRAFSRLGFEFFDTNKDGELSAEEFIEYQWGDALSRLPDGICAVTLEQWLVSFLGPRTTSQNSVWSDPIAVSMVTRLFERSDTDKDGIVTREELASTTYLDDFRRVDRNDDGRISPQEFRPGGQTAPKRD